MGLRWVITEEETGLEWPSTYKTKSLWKEERKEKDTVRVKEEENEEEEEGAGGIKGGKEAS